MTIAKVPEETNEDDLLDWVEEMEEMEQERSDEEAETDQEGKFQSFPPRL